MADKKAYCERCRYAVRMDIGLPVERCRAPDNVYMEDTPLKRVKKYRETPGEKNANNDCSSYERGWRKLYMAAGIAVLIMSLFAVCFLPGILS